MSDFAFRIWGSTNIPSVGAGASMSQTIKWPGGRGQVIVQGFAGSVGVQITPNLTIPVLGISFSGFPGFSPISTNGIFSFEAPESDIRFDISLNTGDSVSWSVVDAIRIG